MRIHDKISLRILLNLMLSCNLMCGFTAEKLTDIREKQENEEYNEANKLPSDVFSNAVDNYYKGVDWDRGTYKDVKGFLMREGAKTTKVFCSTEKDVHSQPVIDGLKVIMKSECGDEESGGSQMRFIGALDKDSWPKGIGTLHTDYNTQNNFKRH